VGDRGLFVEYGDEINPEINNRVHHMLLAIEKAGIVGIDEIIPTYRSILITYNPKEISPKELKKRIIYTEHKLNEVRLPKPKTIEIPIVYGGIYGPDIEFVADYNSLTVDKVIELHSSGKYLVYMIGFTPGFPFLGGLSQKLFTPRLETPRTNVPAGSVGIANNQTGIYPIDSPGGWRLIGKTPLKLYDPHKDPPVLLSFGDYIKFLPISEKEFKAEFA
jgi:KipI family sensor histidine kinase inhibitor